MSIVGVAAFALAKPFRSRGGGPNDPCWRRRRILQDPITPQGTVSLVVVTARLQSTTSTPLCEESCCLVELLVATAISILGRLFVPR